MPSTITGQHLWVRYTVEDVDVIVDPETEELISVSRPDPAVGEQVGCVNCNEPLTAGSVGTGCVGEVG